MTTKICSSCGLDKPLDDFHMDRNRPDGRRSACKLCRSQKHSRPAPARIPAEPPPPKDMEERRRLARQRAIKVVIEANYSQFVREYERQLDMMHVQASWHGLN